MTKTTFARASRQVYSAKDPGSCLVRSIDSRSNEDGLKEMTDAKSKRKKDESKDRFCDFCGEKLSENESAVFGLRRKYCSKQCQQTASRRRTSARLGIPSRVSKLNPLYFD